MPYNDRTTGVDLDVMHQLHETKTFDDILQVALLPLESLITASSLSCSVPASFSVTAFIHVNPT